ncbi:PorP/SprF family type IX secretion system membrane protein [Pelobium manganitolerans]|uniref:PorP/SprF family type IX secretion system membrane protein n=1 Tax=Pelobium manganitolerans TaxID=1842495 RepID=UPI003FA38F90
MRTLLTLLLCFLTLGLFAQQKAMYSQYMFNTLAINPAYAALDESLTFTALSRHQWVGFKGAPNTQTISVHSPIGESNTFVGGILINDQIGEVIRETGGDVSLTQRVPVGYDSYFAVGVNAGSSNFGATYSENYRLSPASGSDPVFEDYNGMRINFGWGAMLFSDKYYVGISAPHFFYRDIGSLAKSANKSAYRPHYILQAGYLVQVNDGLKFKPNFLIKYVNGSPTQFDINANFLINEVLWLGASYRSLDSFDALASVFITPDLQLGYSYDFTATQLAKVQKGSHEIALKFRLPVKGRDHTACYF